jgi:ribosomal protein L37AE/L43A
MEGKQLKYIRVKMTVPACPDCGEQLQGNNSFSNPYKCYKCDVIWKATWENPTLYNKVTPNDNSKEVEEIFKE